MRNTSFTKSLFFITAVACCYSEFAEMFIVRKGYNPIVYPYCMIIYIPFVYLVNYILLKKERSVGVLCAINGVLAAAVFALSLFSCGLTDIVTILIRLLILILLTYYSVELVTSEPSLSSYFIILDVSVVFVLISFAMQVSNAQLHANPKVPLIAAGLSLLGLIDTRIGKSLGAKSYAAAAAGLCAVLGAAYLFSVKIAGAVGGGIVAVSRGVLSAMQFVLGLLERFILWFISLFPEPDGSIDLEQEAADEVFTMAGEGAVELSEIPLVIMIAALLILGLVFFFVFRKVKIGGIKISRVSRADSRSGPSFWESLRMSLQRLSEKIRIDWLLLTKRKNIKAVYFRLERFYAKSSVKRVSGETPREFLKRLRQINSDDPDYAKAFDELADKLDAAFYSGETELPDYRLEKNLYKLTVKQKACILKGVENK